MWCELHFVSAHFQPRLLAQSSVLCLCFHVFPIAMWTKHTHAKSDFVASAEECGRHNNKTNKDIYIYIQFFVEGDFSVLLSRKFEPQEHFVCGGESPLFF